MLVADGIWKSLNMSDASKTASLIVQKDFQKLLAVNVGHVQSPHHALGHILL